MAKSCGLEEGYVQGKESGGHSTLDHTNTRQDNENAAPPRPTPPHYNSKILIL